MNSISDAKKSAIEQRPARMLKEFLQHDDSSSNSRDQTLLSQLPPTPASLMRSRSRSRAAAVAAVASFQKILISAVKSLHLIPPSSSSYSSPPETLQRSLSKRLLTKFRRSSKKSKSCSGERKIVKVKDILRWRSFRDEDKSQPSDSPAASATSTSESSSSGDSDFSFTAEKPPQWWRKGEKWDDDDAVDVDGGDLLRETRATMDAPLVGPEEDNIECEENEEQHSPVSVLNSPFRDEISDEEVTSSFDQSLANVERTKQRLLQSIQWLESLAGVEDQSSPDDDTETEDREEEEEKVEEKIKEENASETRNRDYMLKVLSRLKRGGHGVKGMEECIKDMERQGRWGKCGEERRELVEELESCLMHDLVDELLVHLFG